MAKYDKIEHEGLKFYCRPGTSDEKAVKEVVIRHGYRRRGFPEGAKGHWVDLGANIGAFTVLKAAGGAWVTAVEADPDSMDMVQRNLRLNRIDMDKIRLRQKAVVTDDREIVTLHRNEARGNVWRNSIERTWRGGTDIQVPTIHVKHLWTPKRFIKMDIEGTEMPILEKVGVKVPTQGLVFEWSFDVDDSLVRFRTVINKLKKLYTNVVPEIKVEGDRWLPEWFPPCKTIWCWN